MTTSMTSKATRDAIDQQSNVPRERALPASAELGRPPVQEAQRLELVPSEADDSIATLSKLDEELIVAVQSGLIRFVSVEWLLAQPDDYRLENRQALERREKECESPLLKPDKARALRKKQIRKKTLAASPLVDWQASRS